MKKQIETPKLNKLFEFIGKEAEDGNISPVTLLEFKFLMEEGLEELMSVTLKTLNKSNERIGWLAFGVGVVITTLGALLISFIFS